MPRATRAVCRGRARAPRCAQPARVAHARPPPLHSQPRASVCVPFGRPGVESEFVARGRGGGARVDRLAPPIAKSPILLTDPHKSLNAKSSRPARGAAAARGTRQSQMPRGGASAKCRGQSSRTRTSKPTSRVLPSADEPSRQPQRSPTMENGGTTHVKALTALSPGVEVLIAADQVDPKSSRPWVEALQGAWKALACSGPSPVDAPQPTPDPAPATTAGRRGFRKVLPEGACRSGSTGNTYAQERGITQGECEARCAASAACTAYEFNRLSRSGAGRPMNHSYTKCELQSVAVTHTVPVSGSVCLVKDPVWQRPRSGSTSPALAGRRPLWEGSSELSWYRSKVLCESRRRFSRNASAAHVPRLPRLPVLSHLNRQEHPEWHAYIEHIYPGRLSRRHALVRALLIIHSHGSNTC